MSYNEPYKLTEYTNHKGETQIQTRWIHNLSKYNNTQEYINPT